MLLLSDWPPDIPDSNRPGPEGTRNHHFWCPQENAACHFRYDCSCCCFHDKSFYLFIFMLLAALVRLKLKWTHRSKWPSSCPFVWTSSRQHQLEFDAAAQPDERCAHKLFFLILFATATSPSGVQLGRRHNPVDRSHHRILDRLEWDGSEKSKCLSLDEKHVACHLSCTYFKQNKILTPFSSFFLGSCF